MKAVDPIKLLAALLIAGYSIAYVDMDKNRRQAARRLLKSKLGNGTVFDGTPSGRSTIHHDITIAINPHNFCYDDWKIISVSCMELWVPESEFTPKSRNK